MNMFDGEKITLDKETFKVLSSDTRVEILKLLRKRRMTLSELAKFLGMSVSSVKEHLDNLCKADLIKQLDEGHKWKYYQLTGKGKEIVDPVEKKVFIVLGLSLVAGISSIYSLMSKTTTQTFRALPMAAEKAVGAGEVVLESNVFQAQETAVFPFPEFAVSLASVLVLGLCLGYFYMKRK